MSYLGLSYCEIHPTHPTPQNKRIFIFCGEGDCSVACSVNTFGTDFFCYFLAMLLREGKENFLYLHCDIHIYFEERRRQTN